MNHTDNKPVPVNESLSPSLSYVATHPVSSSAMRLAPAALPIFLQRAAPASIFAVLVF